MYEDKRVTLDFRDKPQVKKKSLNCFLNLTEELKMNNYNKMKGVIFFLLELGFVWNNGLFGSLNGKIIN